MIVSALFVYWSEGWGGQSELLKVMKDNRSAVYGTLASAMAALLGFAITATSIAVAFAPDVRLNVVKDSGQWDTFVGVFVASMRELGVAAAMAFAALLLDRETTPRLGLLYLVAFTSLLAIFRLGRCVWVLSFVMRLAGQPTERSGGRSG